jgi:hypothetical protein
MRAAPLPPILCMLDGDWDALLPTNQQQLIERLAAYTPIFVAEVPRVAKRSPMGEGRVRRRRDGVTIEDGVYVYTMIDRLPHAVTRHSKILSQWADRALCRKLARAYLPLDWPRPILWLCPPDAGNFLGVFDECLSVYAGGDSTLARDHGMMRVAPYDERKTEEYVIRHVDLVIAPAQPFYARCQGLNPHTVHMAYGADGQSWDDQARAIVTLLRSRLDDRQKAAAGHQPQPHALIADSEC